MASLQREDGRITYKDRKPNIATAALNAVDNRQDQPVPYRARQGTILTAPPHLGTHRGEITIATTVVRVNGGAVVITTVDINRST